MDKPVKNSREAYDYHEAAAYLEEKLGYPLRDVPGYINGITREPVHLDYWHFFVETFEVTNGCYVTVTHADAYRGEDWQKKITYAFIEEFGEGDWARCTFFVEW